MSRDRSAAEYRTETVRHHRIELALHHLALRDLAPGGRERGRRPLLLLHGLGERTVAVPPAHLRWGGPVLGLDFTGHGASTVPVGGGYTSEILVGDVDAVLEHIGEPVTVLGRGLGAYIGLLTAAARPDVVHGLVMADGPGIAGGGVHPGSAAVLSPAETKGPPDPFALLELARDVRPPDYARTIAGFAVEGSQLETPLWVATVVRPAWVEAIVDEPGVATGSVVAGLSSYSD